MTRLIERWFPSREVSESSDAGWGSGNTERGLFTWFAARPAAQAKAAVICSLLPWPEEPDRQAALQSLVHRALTGRYQAWEEVRREIALANPQGASVLDPFSGRGMIPLEAARLGIASYGIDYSPVAVLASSLLTDFPLRNWEKEPGLPFDTPTGTLVDSRPRLVRDVEQVLAQIGQRWRASVVDFYPATNGRAPWAYMWAVTLPCQECGHRFPLVGSYELRKPSIRRGGRGQPRVNDLGQSFYIQGDRTTGQFSAVVHSGSPKRTPPLTNGPVVGGNKSRGKTAVCVHCGHPHPLKLHQRLAGERLGRDTLLIVAELDPIYGKVFRPPTPSEVSIANSAGAVLPLEAPFTPTVPAVPDEQIPLNNGATIRPQLYGAITYGDVMCDRQTLAFIRLARTICAVGSELTDAGLSNEYVRALVGYAGSTVVKQLRYSTRGAWLRARDKGTVEVAGIFVNESTVGFSYDFLETSPNEGPGTWNSASAQVVSSLTNLLEDLPSESVNTSVERGSAIALRFRDESVEVVVTDPPYDAMVYYSDSSDIFFVWLKRCLSSAFPEMTITADQRGIQEKTEEIIVKEHGRAPGEHRDRAHYDALITRAFNEMRRVIRPSGIVTIVFGHGEPEVWKRLLDAISNARLVMTASWPANTESGGQQGKANIETTLTMACRPAPHNRDVGRKGAVESEIKAEIRRRYVDWERWGLAPADMLMAAAGPAMEVVGRYSVVLDAKGEPVDIYTFLPLARAAVQEAMAVEVDSHPLDTFDARTRFALWWVRLYGRQIQAKSELRWQALAASMDSHEVRDLITDVDKGVAFTTLRRFKARIGPDSPVIDVALALAAASESGIATMGEVLAASGRTSEDSYLWGAVKFVADRLPESDPDSIALSRVLRTRDGISNAAQSLISSEAVRQEERRHEDAQLRLL